MFKRYWIIAVALGLAVFFGAFLFSINLILEYKKSHSDQRQAAAQYHTDATQHSPASCGAIMGESGLIGWLTCLADNVSADGGIKQAEYDLNAQQDMAAWALGMLIATIWIAVITLLGVFFVWQTLRATQNMAAETTRIGEAQARAYLAITSAYVDNFKVGGRPKLHIAIKNSGQSPAWGYRTVRTIGFINTNPEFERITIIGEVIPSKSDVGAGVTVYMNELIPRNVSSDDIRGIKAGEYSFVVGGISCYTTVFGQKRKTVFKLKSVYYSEKEDRVILAACAKNNRSN